MNKKYLIFFLLLTFTWCNVHAQPIPNFSVTEPCLGAQTAFLDLSTTPNNFIATWKWTFDDPSTGALNTSTDQFAFHAFSSTGTFNVKLVVVDDISTTDSITIPITILPSPQAEFSFNEPCFGSTVDYLDLSTVAGPETIVGWNWSFGDLSTSIDTNPSKLFGAASTYLTYLTVTSSNSCAHSVSHQVKVHAYPVVNITSDLEACLNEPELFVDQSTVMNGVVAQRNWSFGSIGSDTTVNPSFSFPSTGSFTVLLNTISDGNCSSMDSLDVFVRDLPSASFSLSPLIGIPPLNVNFTNLSNDFIQSRWDFGNGNLSNQSSPVYTFGDTGVHTICLTGLDSHGCTSLPYCDSVLVRKPLNDIAVLGLQYVEHQGLLNLTARVANYGNTQITTGKLIADFGGGYTVQVFIRDTIKAGAEILYLFDSGFGVNLNDEELYVCVEAKMEDELIENTVNNVQCRSIGGDFHFSDPFPNPFQDKVILRIILPESGLIKIEFFDLLGNAVNVLNNENAMPGLNTLEFSSEKLRKGIYVCRATYNSKVILKRMVKL